MVLLFFSNSGCCPQSLAFAEWRDDERGGRGIPPRIAIPWFPGALYSVGFLYLALRGVEITLYTEAEYGVIEPALKPGDFSPTAELEVGAVANQQAGSSSNSAPPAVVEVVGPDDGRPRPSSSGGTSGDVRGFECHTEPPCAPRTAREAGRIPATTSSVA